VRDIKVFGRSVRAQRLWRMILAAATLGGLSATLSVGAATSVGAAAQSTPSAYSGGQLMAADPTGGYWTVTADGVVTAYGGAPSFGSPALSGITLSKPIVGMAGTPSGEGYWLVATDGGIFSYGDASFYGSTGAIHLNKPIVGMATTPDGHGYWLVATDGGIFSYGDASFYGSTGSIDLNKPIVGMATTPDSNGYWLVATDGGIFSFGDASFYGSTGGIHLNQPIIGMAATPDGGGYWLVASDGGIFDFGDAGFHGSLGGSGNTVIGIIVSPPSIGYTLVEADGSAVSFLSPPAEATGTPTQTTTPVTTTTTTTTPTTTTTTPTTTTTTTTPTTTTTTTPAGQGTSSTSVPTVRVSGKKLINTAGKTVRLLGVDVSGTEDACVMDRGFGWEGLNDTAAGDIASWDANAVRVPLNEDCWLGINGVPAQYSGAAYQAAVEQWVASLNQAGMVAILDLHWSAPGSNEAVQQWPMADADHSVTFWSQVASAFASNPSVVFDLFGEPYIGDSHPTSSDWACWLNGCDITQPLTIGGTITDVTYATAGMQQMLDAVRSAGATQPVMVGGLDWANDPCGLFNAGGNTGSCAWLTYEPSDPLHQLVASFHTYDWTPCNNLTCWNGDVAQLAASVPVVAGEFGEDDCSTTFNDQFMDWADQNGVSYLAWTWAPEEAGDDTCTPSTVGTGSANNLQLLSDWGGDPSTVAPEGAAIRAHLQAEDVGKL
jgi:Cellulase (glycosyl hydrolase family 5)